MVGETGVEYVRRVLARTGKTPTQLAREAGLSATTLTRPFGSGDWPHDLSERTIRKVEVATGIPFRHLEAFDHPRVGSPMGFRVVPGLEEALYGRPGAGGIPFSDEALRRLIGRAETKGLAALEMRGDSMEPMISAGDQLVIDTTNQLVEGGVYAFLLERQTQVRRLDETPEGLRVIAENPRYSSYTVSGAAREALKILGRVVWIGRAM